MTDMTKPTPERFDLLTVWRGRDSATYLLSDWNKYGDKAEPLWVGQYPGTDAPFRKIDIKDVDGFYQHNAVTRADIEADGGKWDIESLKKLTTQSPNSDKSTVFNENDSRTWDDNQLKVYEVGHKEGESCEAASWTLMLDEEFDIEASTPDEAKAALKSYILAEVLSVIKENTHTASQGGSIAEYVEIGELTDALTARFGGKT